MDPTGVAQQGHRDIIMKNLFARFVREEEGQDIIEYALLAAFISVLAWLTLQAIGTDVSTMYTKVQSATKDAAS
jgi:Flp pilus assembly pilin Flp